MENLEEKPWKRENTWKRNKIWKRKKTWKRNKTWKRKKNWKEFRKKAVEIKRKTPLIWKIKKSRIRGKKKVTKE